MESAISGIKAIIRIFDSMKAVFTKALSVTLALLLLASTTSWTIGKHYCMGHLVNVSLFAHAEDCGMQMEDTSDHDSLGETKDSCCSDQLIVVEGQDNFKLSMDDTLLETPTFLIAATFSSLIDFGGQLQRIPPNEQYPPPLLVKDIHVLDQVFLI